MDSGQDILLLHFTGDDKPGITTSLTSVLAEHDVTVLDVNQSVIHRTLLLGMMVRIPQAEGSTALLKDLLFTAHRVGLQLRMEPIDEPNYDDWVNQEGLPRFILTLLARQLTASQIAAVSQLVAGQGLNIDTITRLSGRLPRNDDGRQRRACVEFSVRGKPGNEIALRAGLLDITQREPVDLAWQRDTVYRRMRRLVAFDMDSTLIQHEVIDELAREAGVFEQVATITEAAMRGELDFDASLVRRVALLKGLDEAVLDRVANRLQLTEGAEVLVSALKKFGFKTAVLSGGFTYFGEMLQKRLGLDFVHANELEIENGKLTGRVRGPIVNAQRKADLLKEIAMSENISLQQTVAVGDGANDLPMLTASGLGIAFHAKPLVAASAQHKISRLGLDGILYLIGVRDRDLLDDA
ncbi:MAG TPA: phosphoserine phosphatase SerB [Tepidisphaeraceae bacterium]